MRILVLASLVLFLPVCAQALPEIGRTAPDFTATDIEGKSVKLSDYKGKLVVLEWNNPLCPFVKKHYNANNMQTLQTFAKGKGIMWITINSGGPGKEGNMTADEAKEYVSYKHLNISHYINDPEGTIGKLYGAKTTPHMFVIDAKGTLAYMGAIDDKPDTSPASIPVAQNYVKSALDSLLGGLPVATASTQAYGCSVKYAN